MGQCCATQNLNEDPRPGHQRTLGAYARGLNKEPEHSPLQMMRAISAGWGPALFIGKCLICFPQALSILHSFDIVRFCSAKPVVVSGQTNELKSALKPVLVISNEADVMQHFFQLLL